MLELLGGQRVRVLGGRVLRGVLILGHGPALPTVPVLRCVAVRGEQRELGGGVSQVRRTDPPARDMAIANERAGAGRRGVARGRAG